jgi:hypothetical protein
MPGMTFAFAATSSLPRSVAIQVSVVTPVVQSIDVREDQGHGQG